GAATGLSPSRAAPTAGGLAKVKVVGKQKFVGLSLPLLEPFDVRQNNRTENGANLFHVGMVVPNGLSQHLDHDLAQGGILGPANLIEQSGHAQAARFRADRWNLVGDVAVGKMQLKYQFAAIGDIRGKETVARFDPGQVEIGGRPAPERMG